MGSKTSVTPKSFTNSRRTNIEDSSSSSDFSDTESAFVPVKQPMYVQSFHSRETQRGQVGRLVMVSAEHLVTQRKPPGRPASEKGGVSKDVVSKAREREIEARYIAEYIRDFPGKEVNFPSFLSLRHDISRSGNPALFSEIVHVHRRWQNRTGQRKWRGKNKALEDLPPEERFSFPKNFAKTLVTGTGTKKDQLLFEPGSPLNTGDLLFD